MKQFRKSDVIVLFGTSAELIKMWPVMVAISEHQHIDVYSTNQQPIELQELLKRLRIEGTVSLRNPAQGNLVSKLSVLPWGMVVGMRLLVKLMKRRIANVRKRRGVLVLVHGDTMTCLLGAIVGRLAGCTVGHVEAGLRSNDWRNPFPEEMNRVLTAYLAQFHFCPNEIAVANLAGRRGVIVDTNGNTSIDSMILIQRDSIPTESTKSYVLVSLHRAELISNEEVFRNTMEEIIKAADHSRIVMVLDALTRNALDNSDLLRRLESSQIDLRDKMPYPDFLNLVTSAERIVTDSGGLQEECGFLRIPCLVHRRATERFDGIGSTARLSMWEPGAIASFCVEPITQNSNDRALEVSGSPTAEIVRTLISYGVID